MSDIRVIEKPKSVPFSKIHELLWEANTENRKNGFVLKTSEMDEKELENKIGDVGCCYIALNGDKLIGTISAKCVFRDTWYAHEKVTIYMLAGVVPSYQGKGIGSLLADKVFSFARENGCSMIELDTAENNKKAIEIYLHQGFKLVGYKANKNGDHYSVVMIKWLGRCPFSNSYCLVRYMIRKLIVKLVFTPDKRKRWEKKKDE